MPKANQKQYLYQQYSTYFCTITDGMEEIAPKELAELGATNIKAGFRGFYFSADQPTLYRTNYCSRLLTRVLAPLVKFDCPSTDHLYKKAMSFPWDDFLSLDTTFAINATVSNSAITHSQFAAGGLFGDLQRNIELQAR